MSNDVLNTLIMTVVMALAIGAGFYLFAWQVDDSDFAARGWYDTPGMALSAAASSGQPVMVKLGAHT